MNSPAKSPINLCDKIPPGFRLCDECGEYTGTTQSKYLRWREFHPRLATPEEPVSVRCLCEGILCKCCGKRFIHRPISNSYDSDDNSIWHWPWFTGMIPCEDCKKRDGQKQQTRLSVEGKVINYFEPAATAEEQIIRRIKGNYRRRFVSRAMQDQGVASVPDLWKNHEFSEVVKNWLGGQNPQFRGGEDLPDLENGEVEIARLTLANSVHGEVTSLRAKLTKQDGKISLRLVDEYESDIKLAYQLANMPLTSEQVIRLFQDADPTATKFGCEIEFQSFFHADLTEVAQRLGVK